MNASALFTIAHQMTRESVKRFGGDYRVTFAAALRIAYQESKMSTETALNGSEKQIAWATDIRREALTELNALAADLRAAGEIETAEVVENVARAVESQAESRWFIDNRERLWLKARHPAQLASNGGWNGYVVHAVRSHAMHKALRPVLIRLMDLAEDVAA